jgi:hypothetical protein
MANNQNDQKWAVWEERWQALANTMDALAAQYSAVPEPFPRRETLVELVKRLRAFGDMQFHFFRCGFDPAFAEPILEISDEFPPGYVLSMILDQIAYDLEVIQRAADSHMLASSAALGRPPSSPYMQDTLNLADRLAYEYIRRAKGSELITEDETDKTTVLTYFQKSPSIRITPYAPVALVGIPYTAISLSSRHDLLVTPHEIGHYVYWHGTLPKNGPVFRNLKVPDVPIWAKRWIEEIFADVFGCLCAGAPTALSSQDLALQSTLDSFFEDDEDHPVPALRPYVYFKTLAARGKDEIAQLAEELKQRWEGSWNERLKKRPVNDQDGWRRVNRDKVLFTDTISFDVKYEPAEKPVDKIIAAALKILPADLSIESVDRDLVPVDHLYDAFTDWVQSFTEPSPPELQAKGTADLWINWIKKEKFFPTPDGQGQAPPPSSPDNPIGCGKEADLRKDPKGQWIHVLFAAGWQTHIGNHSGGGKMDTGGGPK